MLDHTALGYRYPRDVPLELAVAGDADFPNFQSGDPIEATLLTPTIIFNDVPADETVMRAALFARSEEHTSELQSLMRISYAVFCLKKKKNNTKTQSTITQTNNDNTERVKQTAQLTKKNK